MKYILVLFLILSNSGFSQNEEQPPRPRISFTKLDSKNVDIEELSYTVSSKDTFHREEFKLLDLSKFEYDEEKTPRLLEHYKTSVFFGSKKTSRTVYRLLQWKAPLIIYFDKKIPNRIKKKVQAFYSQTNEIENLTITFTKDIEKANYRIYITDETFDIDPEDYGLIDALEKQKFFFTNCTYSLVKDNIDGIKACTMKISEKQLSNDEILLINLKQGIFFSLGRFYSNYGLNPDESLTNLIYTNKDVLSDLDFSILRLHYYQLYNRRINGTDFENLFQSN